MLNGFRVELEGVSRLLIHAVVFNVVHDDADDGVCVQGVGRRYAHVVLRKADIDLSKRAGELTEDEV